MAFALCEVKAQTYTSNSNGNWNAAARWTITNTAGCGGAIPNTPPVQTNNRPCAVEVVINHNIAGPNDLTIGNNNQVSIQIANNRTLAINRDIRVNGFNNKSASFSGSGTLEVGRDFNFGGNSELSVIGNLDVEVDRRINITQAAQFESDGDISFISDRVIIDGNGSLTFNALTNTVFETRNNQDIIIRDGSNVIFTGTSGISAGRDIQVSGFTPTVRFEGNSFLRSSRDLRLSQGGTLSLEDGSSLAVGRDLRITNNFSLEALDDSNILVDRDLDMRSGSRLNLSNNASIIVDDDLEMRNQAEITLNNNANLAVSDNVELDNQTEISGNGNSQIAFENELSLDGQATIAMSETSSLEVEDNVIVQTNNPSNGLRFTGNSAGTFNSNVTIDNNSSTLFLANDSEVIFNASVDVTDGADVVVRGNSEVTILGDLDLDNSNGTTWTTSESVILLLEGDFSKGSRSDLNVLGSSIFEVCTGSFPLESSDTNINVAPEPAYYGGCRILPVSYAYFEATFNEFLRAGILVWATSKEWENDRFEIERAINNADEWVTIGQLSGAGYSDKPVEYEYRDTNLPLNGGNVFYRLKQIDFDADYEYSEIRTIQIAPLFGNNSWRIFPNPTSGKFFNIELLDSSNYQDEPISLRIISPTGKFEVFRVTDRRYLGSRASDYFRGKAAGIYTIEISWGVNREYHKVVLRR